MTWGQIFTKNARNQGLGVFLGLKLTSEGEWGLFWNPQSSLSSARATAMLGKQQNSTKRRKTVIVGFYRNRRFRGFRRFSRAQIISTLSQVDFSQAPGVSEH